MEFKKQRKKIVYTNPNDKLKAVERVVHGGESTRVIAEELSVSLTSVQTWVKQYRDHGPAFFLEGKKGITPVTFINQEELTRLKDIEKKYQEQEIQIEILKKFQAFLKEK